MNSTTTKIDIYDLYKPLRNHVRTLNLQELLELIHRVQRDQEGSFEIKLRDNLGKITEIYIWELCILAREALLNASLSVVKKQLGVRDLLKLINYIRGISDGISQKSIHSDTDAMRALHPLIHQQGRWQYAGDWDRFYRTFRIYNSDDIHSLLYKKLGVRLKTIYALTFAIAGSARQNPKIVSTNDYSFMGISAEERDAYFAMVGDSLENLSESIKNFARHNESWAFTWNPLEEKPLIQLSPHRPHEYLCPLPELLLRRATDSLFFDLAKGEESYSNPYGMAFQSYVGGVLRAQFKGPAHSVREEQEYWVKKDKKHGVDWIVSDATGHIMLECKTRRIRVDAKSIVDGDPLTKAIKNLAEVVVQHYKNIHDALEGKTTHWMPDGKTVYPVIVTLDDWHLFAPHVLEMLQDEVNKQLGQIKLAELLESLPFTVTSIAQFEQAGQAIAQIGIDRFCSSRVKLTNRHFELSKHASQAFPDIEVQYQRLFAGSDQEMFGHLAHLMDLPLSDQR